MKTEPARPRPEPAALRLADFLPYRLSVLSNTVSRRIADLYDREFGLSVWQWRVMAVAAEQPGLTATEIGQRTAMDKVAVSRAIAGLIERGHLERGPSADGDGRRFHVTLSHAGRAVYERIVPMALAEEARLVEALNAAELAELERLMTKLARAAAPERDLW